MAMPFKIITLKRWREINERCENAERTADTLARRMDKITDGLSAVVRSCDGLRRDMRSMQRMINDKRKKQWQSTGK